MNTLTLYEKISPRANNFPLIFHNAETNEQVSLHWHEHLELLFFKEDGGRIICGGETLTVPQNAFVIINPNELHSIETEVYRFCLIIFPSFFADVSLENVLFQSYIQYDEHVKECFEKISAEYCAGKEGYEMEIKSIAYHLMVHLLRHYKVETLSENEMLLRKNKAHKMGEILQYIGKNYSAKITTSSLAEEAHLSEQYFCHLFKSQTGQSPMSYVNKYRIEKAATLLQNTSMSITETAAATGFDDSNYFTRTFKKYMHVTPSEYKKGTDLHQVPLS